MKRRNGEVQVFSVSFLDVISCALGGTLLLLLLLMTQSKSAADAYEQQAKSMQQQMQAAAKQVQEATKTLDEEKKRSKGLEDAKRKLESAQASLIGLKGEMKNVVFVFDTSGSMKTPKFPEYIGLLENWVKQLDYEKFNVVEFGHEVKAFRSSLVDKSPGNVSAAAEFIGKLQPDGKSTHTLDALKKALGMSGVDTVILFSDGAPKTAPALIHDYVRRNGKGVVINTVAMGNYVNNRIFAVFLQELAVNSNGMFIGR